MSPLHCLAANVPSLSQCGRCSKSGRWYVYEHFSVKFKCESNSLFSIFSESTVRYLYSAHTRFFRIAIQAHTSHSHRCHCIRHTLPLQILNEIKLSEISSCWTKHLVTHVFLSCTSDNILHSRSHPSIRRPHNRLVWRTIDKHLISCTRPTMQTEFPIRGIHRTESDLNSNKLKTKSRLTQIWTFFRVFSHPKW